MPLNFKDEENASPEERDEVAPILHQPDEKNGRPSKLIIIFGALAILLGVLFFVYRYEIIGKKSLKKTSVVEQSPAMAPKTLADTSKNSPRPLAQSKTLTDAKAAISVEDRTAKQQRTMSLTDKYTIYISRFRTEQKADEEASHWNDAGYQAAVNEHDGWYCVSLGRFQSKEEARELADKLKDGFEGGYWITTLME